MPFVLLSMTFENQFFFFLPLEHKRLIVVKYFAHNFQYNISDGGCQVYK